MRSAMSAFEIPWTVAHLCPWNFQARTLESIATSSSGYLPNPWIKSAFLVSPALAGGFCINCATWEALIKVRGEINEWKWYVNISKGIVAFFLQE